jgi:transcriptional regulator of nitric oxide reductase
VASDNNDVSYVYVEKIDVSTGRSEARVDVAADAERNARRICRNDGGGAVDAGEAGAAVSDRRAVKTRWTRMRSGLEVIVEAHDCVMRTTVVMRDSQSVSSEVRGSVRLKLERERRCWAEAVGAGLVAALGLERGERHPP